MLIRDIKLSVETQLDVKKTQQRLMFNGTELKVLLFCPQHLIDPSTDLFKTLPSLRL